MTRVAATYAVIYKDNFRKVHISSHMVQIQIVISSLHHIMGLRERLQVLLHRTANVHQKVKGKAVIFIEHNGKAAQTGHIHTKRSKNVWHKHKHGIRMTEK